MATYWTSIGVMLVPFGLAVLIQWPDKPVVAFTIMFAGALLGVVGLWLTIRDERRAQATAEKEEKRRSRDDLRKQREHDEVIAFIAGTKTKMSTPRVLRLIDRIQEIRGEADGNDDEQQGS